MVSIQQGIIKMLYLFTRLRKDQKLIKDVEAWFDMDIYRGCEFDTDICNYIIKNIDGLEWRQGVAICTNCGRTVIDKLSTGCKGALLAVTHPDLVINSIEFGDNVFEALINVCSKYDIQLYMQYVILARHDNNLEVMLNGRKMNINDALDKLVKKYEPDWEI